MTDMFTKEKRSKIMSKVRGKNTSIELKVRRELWRRGIRYRIHNASLPGKPDISIKKYRLAIFIDGCFWHGCPKHYTLPATNTVFWSQKITRNINRRAEVKKMLKGMNYTVLEYFECRLKNVDQIVDEIESHFKNNKIAKLQR